MNEIIRRELKVAFSKRAQPAWFRILKWLVFLTGCVVLYSTGYFWYWVLGLLLVGLVVHMVYRLKTRGWSRPWGLWKDLEAGRK